ncbi:MAG: hypothetical protein V1782_00400 [Pseudomonadota bacterium]
MILFAAGDVGGARALLPVAAECERRGLSFAILNHGYIVNELPDHWSVLSLPFGFPDNTAMAWLTTLDLTGLVFGSSVHDTVPLTLARQIKEMGLLVVHVLDNWSNYRHRLEHDGLPMLVPDRYTVMDQLAWEAAVVDGVPAEIIMITGQPALASLVGECSGSLPKSQTQGPIKLLFVSEPVEADQGSGPASPKFRGYTEKTVLRLLCQSLQPYADQVTLSILPHPREDRQALAGLWDEIKLDLAGMIVAETNGRQQVLAVDGVIGMASILLYEAWLVGKPVLSLQPGVSDRSLRMLAQRPGVCFVDTQEKIVDLFAPWLKIVSQGGCRPQPDLASHQKAAARIVSLLEKSGAGTR